MSIICPKLPPSKYYFLSDSYLKHFIPFSLDTSSRAIKIKRVKLWISLTLSLVAHFLLTSGVLYYAPKNDPIQMPVEIVYTSPAAKKFQKSETQAYVPQVQVPEKLKFEDDSKANYFSEQRSRVLIETQARLKGPTQNRTPEPQFLQPFQDEKIESEGRKDASDTRASVSDDGFKIFDPKKELEKVSSGPSTISVQLDDNIAMGSMTTLNTDRGVFYSFYNRLEARTYGRWHDHVNKMFDSYPASVREKLFKNKKLTTQVVILLKPNGEFHRAEIYSSSGIKKLDMTSALAFQDARIFPNPPREMIRPDGFIHISASFTVDFRPVQ